MKKTAKKLTKILAVLLALNTAFIFAVGAVIFHLYLKRSYSYIDESGTVQSTEKLSFYTGEENWLQRESKSMFIVSYDGLNLHGYYVKNEADSHKYAIVCHGYSADGSGMSYYAKRFYNMGYSVLVPDARCHGRSEGEIIGMGYFEKDDILLWIEEITKEDPKAQIVLFGVSMGGATVLFTSGEGALPSCVKAVISDCAYTDVYNQIGCAIRYTLPWMPSFPIVDCVSVICKLSGGHNLKEASCVEAVKRSKTPTLFIHGSADTYVPFYMLDILYENAACEKEKLVVEGAEHVASARTDAKLYWRAIEEFIGKYIQ